MCFLGSLLMCIQQIGRWGCLGARNVQGLGLLGTHILQDPFIKEYTFYYSRIPNAFKEYSCFKGYWSFLTLNPMDPL